MEQRYKALRIIGTVYKVLGGLVGIVTLLLVVTICASSVLGGAALTNLAGELGDGSGVGGLFGGVLGGVILSLVAILYGGTIAVTLFGFGEGVYLLIALEENTRATAGMLKSQTSAS
jgi:hypothetical protein